MPVRFFEGGSFAERHLVSAVGQTEGALAGSGSMTVLDTVLF
jgi:hypothetical protein